MITEKKKKKKNRNKVADRLRKERDREYEYEIIMNEYRRVFLGEDIWNRIEYIEITIDE